MAQHVLGLCSMAVAHMTPAAAPCPCGQRCHVRSSVAKTPAETRPSLHAALPAAPMQHTPHGTHADAFLTGTAAGQLGSWRQVPTFHFDLERCTFSNCPSTTLATEASSTSSPAAATRQRQGRQEGEGEWAGHAISEPRPPSSDNSCKHSQQGFNCWASGH